MMEIDIRYNSKIERTVRRPEGNYLIKRAFIDSELDIVYFYGIIKKKKFFRRFKIEPGETQAIIFGDSCIVFMFPIK